MQRAMRVSCVASLFFLGSCRRIQIQANPVSKVIELLNKLVVEIKAEGVNATKTQAEFQAACKDETKDMNFSIMTLTSKVADANSTIFDQTVVIQSLTDDISKNQAFLADSESQLANATALRENESAVFQTEEAELVDLADSLRRAIGILQNEIKKNGSFMQGVAAKPVMQALASLVQGSVLNSTDATRLSALVQRSDEDADDIRLLGAPDAAVYTRQSDSIVDTLESLLEEAQGQLSDSRKNEMSAAHAYNMEKQLRETEAKDTKESLATAQTLLAEATAAKNAATETLAADSQSLSERQAAFEALTTGCTQGALDFEAETKSRGEELEAIAEALKGVGAAVNASATTYSSAASFLQRSQVSETSQGAEVVRLLHDLAAKEKTPELAQLASRVAFVLQHGTQDGADPLAKVKDLISKLLAKLEAEAATDKKCNDDIMETQAESDEKTLAVQKLTAAIDGWSSEMAVLGEEMRDLKESLAQLIATQAAMDKARKDEAAEFTQRKTDLTDGLQGVGLAIKILTEFYAKQGKRGGSATGIIGMLELIDSDFTRDLAAAEEIEYSAQSAYETTSKSNGEEKKRMEQDIEKKAFEWKTREKYVKENSVERSSLQEELDAVNKYLEERKKQCEEKELTYEEKMQRRKNEIDGLKEALKVLESLSLLQERTRHTKSTFRLRPAGK